MTYFFYPQVVVFFLAILAFVSFILACVNAFSGVHPSAVEEAAHKMRGLLGFNTIFFTLNALSNIILAITIGLNIGR